jgi:hypothetical protein
MIPAMRLEARNQIVAAWSDHDAPSPVRAILGTNSSRHLALTPTRNLTKYQTSKM